MNTNPNAHTEIKWMPRRESLTEFDKRLPSMNAIEGQDFLTEGIIDHAQI